jgi:hypothetical protein
MARRDADAEKRQEGSASYSRTPHRLTATPAYHRPPPNQDVRIACSAAAASRLMRPATAPHVHTAAVHSQTALHTWSSFHSTSNSVAGSSSFHELFRTRVAKGSEESGTAVYGASARRVVVTASLLRRGEKSIPSPSAGGTLSGTEALGGLRDRLHRKVTQVRQAAAGAKHGPTVRSPSPTPTMRPVFRAPSIGRQLELHARKPHRTREAPATNSHYYPSVGSTHQKQLPGAGGSLVQGRRAFDGWARQPNALGAPMVLAPECSYTPDIPGSAAQWAEYADFVVAFQRASLGDDDRRRLAERFPHFKVPVRHVGELAQRPVSCLPRASTPHPASTAVRSSPPFHQL